MMSNGIAAHKLRGAAWVKSSFSTAQGNCVEVATLSGGEVALRNSRDPRGPALVYTAEEMWAFIQGSKRGEFDHMIG